jgi:hypothetical protein
MPQAVVDMLEAIQVDEQHRQPPPLALGVLQRMLEA